jgi:hypothetical protein
MKSRLWLKTAPEHAGKRDRAAAYKRTFGGICGGMTWKDLAVVTGAGRPVGKVEQRRAAGVEVLTRAPGNVRSASNPGLLRRIGSTLSRALGGAR